MRPGGEVAELGPLVGEHLVGLVPGDRQEQLLLALREVVEELALARAGPAADVVERRGEDAVLAYLRRRALDDPLPGRGPFPGQCPAHPHLTSSPVPTIMPLLDLRVHFRRHIVVGEADATPRPAAVTDTHYGETRT